MQNLFALKSPKKITFVMRETRCVISGKRNHVRTDAAAFSHREYLCAF